MDMVTKPHAVELTWKTSSLQEGQAVIARIYDPQTQAKAGGTRVRTKIEKIHRIDESLTCSAKVGGLFLGFRVLKGQNKAVRDGLIE